MKYQIGDKVEIIDNTSGHEFEIGEVVEIIEYSGPDYKAANGDEWWYIKDKDIRKVGGDKKMKFKVGDIIRGIDNKQYSITDINMTKGEVVELCRNGYFVVKVLEHKENRGIGETHTVNEKYFELVSNSTNVSDVKHYIINPNACIVFWTDGSKTIVKKMPKAKHNKELAFLTAYFQKHCGLSKTKANKFLDSLKETK